MRNPIKQKFRFYLLSLIAVVFSSSVWAHPHSWIDIKTQVIGKDKTVDGFKMEWTFDRMTTAYLLDGEDMSAQHRKQTLQSISKSVIDNMVPSHYFTNLDADKHSFDYQKVTHSVLKVEKGKAILSFTLLLKKPYLFDGKDLYLRIFDPTYYVDMSWKSLSDFQFSKTMAAECTSSLIKPHPTPAQVNRAMTIPMDANPDYQLGKVFTQAIKFSCGS
ncbi:DUF1007 family protein [Vibrio gallicus]|uniref:DUF1007 family protein n=1 Tax=Vibrio gallicus TaxID=190897 RepID=UPI0021C2E52A|nr:DUF1007 family protein [Vibrio gallicus]